MHVTIKKQRLDNLWASVNDAHGQWDEGEIDDTTAFARMEEAVAEFEAADTLPGRVARCAAAIDDAIGPLLVEYFPEIRSGDVDPGVQANLCAALETFVKHWVLMNQDNDRSLYGDEQPCHHCGLPVRWTEPQSWVHKPGDGCWLNPEESEASELRAWKDEDNGPT